MSTKALHAVAVTVLLAACTGASTSTTTAPSTSQPATTIVVGPGPSESTSTTSTTIASIPLPEPVMAFVPEVFVDQGVASMVVLFPDGSTVDLAWPADLDLVSDGLLPYAWAQIPHRVARDFVIRHGEVPDVLATLGDARLLQEYPNGVGGTVGLWQVSGDEVDYLAFDFDPWTVLVYDYRGFGRMSDADRELWATNFHGMTTDEGFLTLTADHPLRLSLAGEYPSPMQIALHSPRGVVWLVPEDCAPGFVSEIDLDDFAHWCDGSGRISIRVSGTPEFQQAVHDGLVVQIAHFGMRSAPDRNESYQALIEDLEAARARWEQSGLEDYSISVSGHFSIAAIDAEAVFRGGTVVQGRGWLGDEPLTVESLFDLIEEAIAVEADAVGARFHSQLGYPTRLVANPSLLTSDDEWGFEVMVQLFEE